MPEAFREEIVVSENGNTLRRDRRGEIRISLRIPPPASTGMACDGHHALSQDREPMFARARGWLRRR